MHNNSSECYNQLIMEHVISVENMRNSDQNTIASGTPSLVLMERAARGIREAYTYPGKTAIVVGSGNNGGDGFALAMILASEQKEVSVISVSDHYSADSAYYKERCEELGLGVIAYSAGAKVLGGFDTIVDCLLGTGFKGDVRGLYSDAIDEINASSSFVVSADINSGMNGNTGEYTKAVRSDLTVTIGFLKTGLVRALINKDPAIGNLVCTDIGITLDKEENFLLDNGEWQERSFPPSLHEYAPGDGRVYFRY